MRHKHKRAVAVVAAVVAGASLLVARSLRRGRPRFLPVRGTVRRVVDGDSFHLTNCAEVRMLELDAPEMTGPDPRLARRSRDALVELIEGKVVRLEPGPRERDRYGRFLAYVLVQGGDGEVLVNAEIVRRGLARARLWGAPAERWKEVLAAEKDARAAGRGMWAKAGPGGPKP
ncbi:MAG: thermonuclease family protein [Planctomycetota bacterium]